MNDYINPFAAMGGLDTIESPFLRSQERGNREILARPFIDMARQQQIMDMTKKDAELGEWSSPEAVAARRSKIQENQMTSQHNMMRMPDATAAINQENKDKVSLAPYLTEQHKQQAIEVARKAAGGPAQRFFDEIGSANQEIRKVGNNPAAREMLAQKFIQRWKDMNPGAQLPASMQKYDQLAWDMAENVSLYSKEHRQKLELEEGKQSSAEERARIMATMNLNRQGMANQGRIDAEGAKPPPKLSPGQAYTKDADAFQSSLGNPSVSPEERNALRQRVLSSTHFQESLSRQAKEKTDGIFGFDKVKDKDGKEVRVDRRQRAIEEFKRKYIKENQLEFEKSSSAPAGAAKRSLGTLDGYEILEIKPNGDRVITREDGKTATIPAAKIKK